MRTTKDILQYLKDHGGNTIDNHYEGILLVRLETTIAGLGRWIAVEKGKPDAPVFASASKHSQLVKTVEQRLGVSR